MLAPHHLIKTLPPPPLSSTALSTPTPAYPHSYASEEAPRRRQEGTGCEETGERCDTHDLRWLGLTLSPVLFGDAVQKKSAAAAAAAAADPLAGSAEWDPNTVTPNETNLGAKLTGKVALITGSGRGLGRAFAERLAALGCKIVIQGRNEAGPAQYGEGTTLSAVAEAVGKRYKVPTMKALADLTEPEQVDRMVKEVIKKFGTIDILVHNAGGDIAKKGGKPKPNSKQDSLATGSTTRATQ